MCNNLCIETIRVENRIVQNVMYHNRRLNKTRKDLYGCTDVWDLNSCILIPNEITNEPYKLRMLYSEKIEEIKWEIHEPRVIRSVKKVYAGQIEYGYKYEDRELLNNLFAQRGGSDEIMIIRNGMVTDSCFANIAFFDGRHWYTADSPLLEGTQRACLLDSGMLSERTIAETDLAQFTHFKLFNALMTWDNTPILEIGMIV